MNPRSVRHLASALATLLAATLLPAIAQPPALAADRVGLVVKRQGDAVAVLPNTVGAASAACRRGETLIGGGAITDGADFFGIFLRVSAPDPKNARRWIVRGFSNDSEDYRSLRAYAFCARAAHKDRVGVIVRKRGTAKSVDPAVVQNVFATCQRGETLVNGGALGTGAGRTAGVLLRASGPDPDKARRWFVKGYNNNVEEKRTMRAFAFCARASSPDRVQRIVKRAGPSVAVPGDGVADAFASCKRGEDLVGGGAFGTGTGYDGIFLQVSAPDPNKARRWLARGANSSEETEHVRAYAFCAR